MEISRNCNSLKFYHEAELFSETGQPVMVQNLRQEPTWMHSHDFTEMVLVLSGNGSHHTAAGINVLSGGDFFILDKGQKHAYPETDNLRLVNIIIRNSNMKKIHPVLKGMEGYKNIFSGSVRKFVQPRRLLPRETEELYAFTEVIRNESLADLEGKGVLLESVLMQLLVKACRMATADYSAAVPPEEIRNALNYLNENYSHKIYLDELETLTFMTRRSLQRKFMEYMRVTPMEYLLRIRLSNAARQLRESNDKASIIAQRCGFSDATYFHRLFKRETGLTPAKYRGKFRAGHMD